ncbi:hypothetical protein M378DRAFT_1027459, partial [Amanita muscaria Koide BX008]
SIKQSTSILLPEYLLRPAFHTTVPLLGQQTRSRVHCKIMLAHGTSTWCLILSLVLLVRMASTFVSPHKHSSHFSRYTHTHT